MPRKGTPKTNVGKGNVRTSVKSSDEQERCDPVLPPFPLCGRDGGSFSEAFANVVRILKGRKRVLVLAGAGISVSCGIPDFRSKDKGLYSTMDFQELGLSCPEELFDLDVFQEDPKPFYRFAKAIFFPLGTETRVSPSDSHRFLAFLDQNKMLLRVYTQNIDGLEEQAGVSAKRMVYAHGSLARATCMRCKRKVDASEIESAVLKGQVARCKAKKRKKTNRGDAIAFTSTRSTKSRTTRTRAGSKRKLDSDLCRGDDKEEEEEKQNDADLFCNGVLKPNVTFFGETLHDKVRRSLETDRSKADALLVMGTSLSV